MGIISTTAFTFRLIANGQQLDLFQDEDIQLSNNVTGLFDIGLQPADFTRQITIPGSKVNNAFFEHYYDISINNPFLFSTSTKVNAYFEFDSLYLSNGYIQLNKVNLLQNKFIESYEITMYGTISSFGRDINKLFLTDLNSLQRYNHTSSYDNITGSWAKTLFDGDIVYPWADYGSGWTFTQGDSFFGVDDNYGGLSVQDYKPAIRLKKVWDAVFEDTGYTYSSSFWNEPWLNDVYMVCNNQLRYPVYSDVDLETFGVIKVSAISGSGMTDLNIPNDTWTTLPWYNELVDPGGFINNGAYTVTKESNLSGVFNLNLNVSSSNGNVPGQFWLRMIETGSGTPVGESTIVSFNQFFTQVAQSRPYGNSINQTFELQSFFPFPGVNPGTYYFQIKINEYYVAADPTYTLDPDGSTKSYIEIRKVNQAADNRVIDIPYNMPYGTKGIKLVDFITGIQRKFNLVMYPDTTSPNRFIIETFNNWYNKGEIRDFNKYINLNSPISVTPANNLAVNNLNFGDTLDTDYVSQQFFKGANREYAKQYYIDTENFFSQGALEVKTTFASSPLLRMAGTGLSGSVDGFRPTPTQFYAGNLIFTPSSYPYYVCTSPISYDVYTISGTLTQGEILYYDRYGTSPITGYYYFSAGYGSEITEVDRTTGEIGYGSGNFC